jgi:ParB family chromosome partitioning protein
MEILDQEYTLLDVSLLRPHEHNPNRGDEKALEESVDANGFYGAVTVRPHPDEEGAYQILAGEHRWRLAARRGKPQIPAMVLTDVDDVQAVRILLADNEVTRRGSYDKDALDRALDSLGTLKGSGFDDILDAAGKKKDDEDEAEKDELDDEQDGEYSDDGDSDSDFAQEWGVLVMADSELEQQAIFEFLSKTYGASKLRVVSV